MLVAIINEQSEVLFIESIFSQAIKKQCGLGQIAGSSIVSSMRESKGEWFHAVTRCFGNRSTETCEIVLGDGEYSSRWRMQISPVNGNQAMVVGVSLPLNITDLSEREIEVMRHVSLDRSTEQIAEALDISVSTVEKHRHRIRGTLSIKGSMQLLLVAKTMFNVDGLFFGPINKKD